MFQEHTLLPWSNLLENVTLPLKLRGVPKKERHAEGERVLELVGLKEHTKGLPRQLSGGMKMKVSIARALICRPKLLLMDEPFGALDEITRQTLQDELLNIWSKEKQMTVLFITHNVFEAVFLSTRVVVMTPRPGKISEIIDIPFPFPRDEAYRTKPELVNISASYRLNQALKGREVLRMEATSANANSELPLRIIIRMFRKNR